MGERREKERKGEKDGRLRTGLDKRGARTSNLKKMKSGRAATGQNSRTRMA